MLCNIIIVSNCNHLHNDFMVRMVFVVTVVSWLQWFHDHFVFMVTLVSWAQWFHVTVIS